MRYSPRRKNDFKSQIKLCNRYAVLSKPIIKQKPVKPPVEIDYLLDYLFLCVIYDKDPEIELLTK